MDVIYERCCGLDVHKRTIAACLIVPGMGGAPQKEIRTFGTMTEDLLELTDWLVTAGCTHVAMESTGVYWKPTLQSAGSDVHAAFGQRPAHQECPGAQDRREGLRVDRRSAQARPVAGQLRARTTPKGVAGTGPLPDGPGAGALS